MILKSISILIFSLSLLFISCNEPEISPELKLNKDTWEELTRVEKKFYTGIESEETNSNPDKVIAGIDTAISDLKKINTKPSIDPMIEKLTEARITTFKNVQSAFGNYKKRLAILQNDLQGDSSLVPMISVLNKSHLNSLKIFFYADSSLKKETSFILTKKYKTPFVLYFHFFPLTEKNIAGTWKFNNGNIIKLTKSKKIVWDWGDAQSKGSWSVEKNTLILNLKNNKNEFKVHSLSENVLKCWDLSTNTLWVGYRKE